MSTKESKKEPKEPNKFEMVLFRCPYCGALQLKELEMIRIGDTWSCTICDSHFSVA
jgi:transcription elongation factor Elf1